MLKKTLFILALSAISWGVQARESVVHMKISNDNDAYPMGLLKLALGYHGSKYKMEELDEVISQAKQIEEVNYGGMSVLVAGTSMELEEELLPIRIPLWKGFLGNRIFIIRRDKQSLFDGVKTFDDLKEIRLGQGTTWADTQILRSADLNVITAFKYPGLFYMLEGERFDAFPRGVHEPWIEVERHRDLGLTVEKNLMVVYRMPMYFFVSRDNKKLARDIEEGLEKAIVDGSFDEFFFKNKLVKSVLEQANLGSRKVFYVDNPLMHPKTPVDRQELWFKAEKKKGSSS